MGSKVKRFEDLYVWQKARELVKVVYRISAGWRDRSLQDQIRRAVVSVVSNIAEGFERGTKNEFLYFLYVARGSCGEVRSQLYVALDQGYVENKVFEKGYDLADYVSRLLAKFIRNYEEKGHAGQRYSQRYREHQKARERIERSKEDWKLIMEGRAQEAIERFMRGE